MSDIKPTTVTFRGPERSAIVIDEDGPRLVVDGKSVMEWAPLQQLVKIITAAGEAWQAGQVATPVPPSREEARWLYGDEREAYMAKRAQRAIAKEFAVDAAPDVVPF